LLGCSLQCLSASSIKTRIETPIEAITHFPDVTV
jgi:hypothetical protein